jgi:hypothetical protein
VTKRIVAALCALFWGYFGYVGFDLVFNVTKRGVPGYPNAGQWELYVAVPTAMMLLGVGLVFLSKKAPTALYAVLLSMEIIAIPPFLMIYGGGV